VPIGRPVNQTQVYILDPARNPSPIGVAGELYIGGDGLACGYLNRPELTAEKFVTIGGERLYRTGDLTRWMPDGNIEFLGRMDKQVKVRGFRVEPGEIEAALMAHPEVREAIVIARPAPGGSLQLIAYARCGESAREELRDFLLRRLPNFMVPSHFVAVAEFPLTPNGKVDHRALPDPLASAPPRPIAPPRNSTETVLEGIWREVLEREQVGIHDNFFQLGGHSLLAAQIIARISQSFDVEIPVRMIFEAPTIAELAETVDEARSRPAAHVEISLRRQPSQAEKLLARLDNLSDSEVEELLLELEENEIET
jgi:acyl carrier protein